MHWNSQSLLLEVRAQGVHGGTFSLVLLSQEAPSAGVWVVVPHSVGAGAALHVAVFSHLVSCISPSPSDRNWLVQLEEQWESVGPGLWSKGVGSEGAGFSSQLGHRCSAFPLCLDFSMDKTHPILLFWDP